MWGVTKAVLRERQGIKHIFKKVFLLNRGRSLAVQWLVRTPAAMAEVQSLVRE